MREITSKQNKKLKMTRLLLQKKHRQNYSLFLAEGYRLINQLIEMGLSPEWIVTKNRDNNHLNSKYRYEDCLYYIEDNWFDEISQTVESQGIIAVFPIPRPISYDVEKFNLCLVLDAIQDPGNMGTILRTALSVQVEGIILMPGCVDVYSPKVVRSSLGAIGRLQFYDEKLIPMLRKYHYHFYHAKAAASTTYIQDTFEGKIALVLGNEGRGITQVPFVSSMDKYISIPMSQQMESLNVSIAAAVLLYRIIDKKGWFIDWIND